MPAPHGIRWSHQLAELAALVRRVIDWLRAFGSSVGFLLGRGQQAVSSLAVIVLLLHVDNRFHAGVSYVVSGVHCGVVDQERVECPRPSPVGAGDQRLPSRLTGFPLGYRKAVLASASYLADSTSTRITVSTRLRVMPDARGTGSTGRIEVARKLDVPVACCPFEEVAAPVVDPKERRKSGKRLVARLHEKVCPRRSVPAAIPVRRVDSEPSPFVCSACGIQSLPRVYGGCSRPVPLLARRYVE